MRRKRGRKTKSSRNGKRGRPNSSEKAKEEGKAISSTVYHNLSAGKYANATVSKATQTMPPRKRTTTPSTPAMRPVRKKYNSKYLEDVKDTLQNKTIAPCKQGKSHSVDTIKAMIFGVSNVMVNFQVTFTSACFFVAKLLGAGKNQVRAHCNRWFKEQVMKPTDNSRRGAGSDRYGTDKHILKREHLHHIVQYVDNNNVRLGGMVGVKSIQSSLRREFGRTYSRHALYYALKVRLGYVYKKPKDLRVAMSPKRKAQLRKHWLQRDLALKLQKADKAVVYYVDESYVHQNHFPEDCWYHPERPDVVRPAGKGQRLVIVHAIALTGLAFKPDADGNPPRPDEFDSSVCENAEMIFRAKSARGDYHDNYDTDTFIMWMERRMLPAFKAKHGDEKTLVLVLDNAPYHHGRCEDGFFPKERSKAEIAAKLLSLRCHNLEVTMCPDPTKQVPQPVE